MFWFIAAKARGLDVVYEKITLEVELDGAMCRYTPDFWIASESRFAEVKGRRYVRSMRKMEEAQRQGNTIDLVGQDELEEWCAIDVKTLYRTLSLDGWPAVEAAITDSVSRLVSK